MFDISKISNVYSGRKGCACGCRGKYTYASKFKCDRPDYYDPDEGVNDRVVKTIVNRVEMLLHDPQSIDRVMVDPDGDYFAIELEHDRVYAIYFAQRDDVFVGV